MNTAIEPTITVDKYNFVIADTLLYYEEHIYSRSLQITVNTSDCVKISIRYSHNTPISAYIPYPTFKQCNSDDSIVMIRAILNYLHKQLPTITEVAFDDMSNIECATDEDTTSGTNAYHVPLNYFSIAFNGVTWYEKHFNARQKDVDVHRKYRERVQQLLYSAEYKTGITFQRFVEISSPPQAMIAELHKLYDSAPTYNDFFQSMPKMRRFVLVRDWITQFMRYHLKGVFNNTDWIIPIPIVSHRGTRKYWVKGTISRNTTYKDIGVDAKDI